MPPPCDRYNKYPCLLFGRGIAHHLSKKVSRNKRQLQRTRSLYMLIEVLPKFVANCLVISLFRPKIFPTVQSIQSGLDSILNIITPIAPSCHEATEVAICKGQRVTQMIQRRDFE
mmetsp:Transcript_28102/g.52728  ORF Transcript_28102/g.52728 Transcript_28102/m.52728 type:complete len:115 (-) Transcript_28102:416-760(-)